MKIAVLTSGGDAPGMNVAIRAVVRYGNKLGYDVFGVNSGFKGLVLDDLELMSSKSVSGIINKGGTILRTARFPEFKDEKVIEQAANNLKNRGIDNLVVIGGDGSFAGGKALIPYGINIIGIPGTIDNDIYGTDYTIGFNTALDTIVDAIDKLRDTSASHQRCSIIEVMGRNCGDLALHAALSGGAEFLITPENPVSKETVIAKLKQYKAKDRNHAIIVVTEKILDVHEFAREISRETEFSSVATVLGYVQRGGSPVAYDRMLATRMGTYAVSLIKEGNYNVAIGIEDDSLTTIPIDIVLNNRKRKSPLYKLVEEVS